MTSTIQKFPHSASVDPQLQSTFLNYFHEDHVFEIFSRVYQENFKALGNIRGACKRLYYVLDDPSLWERIYNHSFPFYPKPTPMEFISAYSGIIRNETNIAHGIYKSDVCNVPNSRRHICALLVSGRHLITGSWAKDMRMYSESGKCLKILKNGHKAVAAFSIRKGRLVSICLKQTIKEWDTKTEKRLKVIRGDGKACEKLIVGGDKFFSGFADGKIEVRDVKTGKLLMTFLDHQAKICSLSFYNGNLFSGSEDGVIHMWNLELRECLLSYQAPPEFGSVSSFAFFNGLFFAGFNSCSKILNWDIATRSLQEAFEGDKNNVKYLAVIAGKLVSYSNSDIDGVVKFWDISTKKCLSTFKSHLDAVNTMTAFREKLYLVGGEDVIRWDFSVEKDEVLHEINTVIKNTFSSITKDSDEDIEFGEDDSWEELLGEDIGEAEERLGRLPDNIKRRIDYPEETMIANPNAWAIAVTQGIDKYFGGPETDAESSQDPWMEAKDHSKKRKIE